MNSSTTPTDSSLASATTLQNISLNRRLYWSIRRELWEHPWLYIAPLAVAALALLGSLISVIHPSQEVRAALALNPSEALHLQSFHFTLIMGITFIVTLLYCLGALHGERRDRSILFWKSLPVSDLETVLSKAIVAILIMPLFTLVLTVVLEAGILLFSSIVVLAHGQSVPMLWTNLPLIRIAGMVSYHLVAIHMLWYAPIYSGLLLISAWARRMPILWATLPFLTIALVEKSAFNTLHFFNFIAYRLGEGLSGNDLSMTGMSMMDLHPIGFLATPGLWIGFAAAAVFLAGAARLRRFHGPI